MPEFQARARDGHPRLRSRGLRRRTIDQPLDPADQMGRLIAVLRDHRVGPGVLLRQSKRLGDTGKKDDTRVRFLFANPADELDAGHHRHTVIRDNHVEMELLEKFKAFLPVTGNLHLQTLFFQQGAADKQTISTVIDKEDVRRQRRR